MSTTGYFVLILKCTEAHTVPAAVSSSSSTVAPVEGEDTNMYEKIHMYKINDENKFNELKNLITSTSSTLPENKYDKDNNHAIIFITLTNGEIATSDGYIEKKYFKDGDISNNFISQIDTTSANPNATEMNCYKSTYAIKGITPDTDNTFNGLTLGEPTTANILINNGGKIVVTSSENNDQLILHYVSKMFGFEDIMKDLVDKNNVSGGGGEDDDVEGGENNDFTAEELAEYQNQMEQQQQGGKKKRSKQNTKKRNQK
jgi:hypothetical protein